MTSATVKIPPMPHVKLRRFFRTPKGLLIAVLFGLAAVAAFGAGFRLVAPDIAAAVAIALAIDAPILRFRGGEWVFPDGALLTGLIVGMVLSPHEPWYVAAFASAVGVISKYVIRSRTANVFNPAALALFVDYFVFHSGQSWWGALPELSPPSLEPGALALLIGTGLLVADRVNRLPAVLSFLGAYYLLFTVTAFVGDPARVASIYRSSDLHAALFFAFFMVTDPPTSPTRPRDQLIYGVTIAVISYTVYRLAGGIYYLLTALLLANIGEAWRRVRASPLHLRKHAT